MEIYRPIELRPDESLVDRVHSYLIAPAFSWGKNGRLVLTDERLLWTPIRFPFPRSEPVSLELSEITDCDVGRSRDLMGRPLVVEANQESFQLYFGENPTKGLLSGGKTREAWKKLIRSTANLV